MENQVIQLPVEVAQAAASVSAEKRNEVQVVLNQVFQGVSKMREQLDAVSVADENDKTNMSIANAIRLGVRQQRLDAEKVFDAKRAEVQAQMAHFKTEDMLWLKAKQTMQILTKEIEEAARYKEETKIRYDAMVRAQKIADRAAMVHQYNPDIHQMEFSAMSDDAKIEAQRKAEEERRMQEEEQRRLAEIRIAQEAQERARLEAERKAAEERAEAEAAQRRAAEEELRKKQEEAMRLEAELRAKKIAEEKAEAERLAKIEQERLEKLEQEKRAASAPDKAKLTDFIEKIRSIEMPVMSSPEGQLIIKDTQTLFSRLIGFLSDKIEKL
jgi:hypothetical protein